MMEQEFIEVISQDIVGVRTEHGFIEVTRSELEEYMLRETRSLSGLRTLAGIAGDWRMMDAIAEGAAFVFNQMGDEK